MPRRNRARLQAGAALLVVLWLSLLAAGTAFATSGRPINSVDQAGVTTAALEPNASPGLVRQGFDLLLDNFVTPPPPSRLVKGAVDAVIPRLIDAAPGEWAPPTVSADADREQAWLAFGAWLDQVAVLAGPRLGRDAIQEAALRGMVAVVDEHHTRYLTPAQYEEHQAWRRDDVRYGGIGARLRGTSAVILEVFANSPAERAGLRVGDRILRVDGDETAGVPTEGVIGRIRGPLGTFVQLLVERRGVESPFVVSVERAEIKIAFVRWDVLRQADGRRFGYIQVRGFPDPGVDDRVGDALTELQKVGVDGLVLDFRGNSGGRIDVGLKVASRFISDGAVYQQLDRGGKLRTVHTVGGYWSNPVPIVTLVDGGTASMGEIVASAMQDAGVSRIVGTQTSGNVAGARMFPLANGGAFQITVLSIVSGRGATLNDVGVTPDERVDFQDDALLSGIDVQLQAGIRYLQTKADGQRAALLPWLPRAVDLAEAA
jgi:carboxyl-terminal processing protease